MYCRSKFCSLLEFSHLTPSDCYIIRGEERRGEVKEEREISLSPYITAGRLKRTCRPTLVPLAPPPPSQPSFSSLFFVYRGTGIVMVYVYGAAWLWRNAPSSSLYDFLIHPSSGGLTRTENPPPTSLPPSFSLVRIKRPVAVVPQSEFLPDFPQEWS